MKIFGFDITYAHWAEMDLVVILNFYFLCTVIVVKLSKAESGEIMCRDGSFSILD